LKVKRAQNGFVVVLKTKDGFFKFCDEHKDTLHKAIIAQIDELDTTRVVK